MGKVKKLSSSEISQISMLKDKLNMSNRKIANMIDRNEKVIRNFFKDRENYGQNYHGRKSSLTTRHKSLLIRDACISLKSPSKLRVEFNLNVGVRRTQQLLSSCEFIMNKKQVKKPFQSKQNIEVRMKFAINHIS